MVCRSLPQIVASSTRTSTSPAAGLGIGWASTVNPPAGPLHTAAVAPVVSRTPVGPLLSSVMFLSA